MQTLADTVSVSTSGIYFESMIDATNIVIHTATIPQGQIEDLASSKIEWAIGKRSGKCKRPNPSQPHWLRLETNN